MISKKHKDLIAELPNMVCSGLITEDQRLRICNHYQYVASNKSNTTLLIFSILGSVLLASGIILILAHNWADIPRIFRTVIAFVPLIASQAIGFWVIKKRTHSLSWTEGISAFIFLSVGAVIALISQIYHIKGSLESYLFTWMMLSIPVAYVFRSITASVLYIAGITAWAIAERVSGGTASFYWVLLLIAIPLCYHIFKISATDTPRNLLGWFVGTSIVCGGTLATGSFTEGAWVLVMLCIFISMISLGTLQFPEDASVWKSPFYSIGILGVVVTSVVLSYRGLWEYLSFKANPGLPLTCYLGSIGVAIAAIILSTLAIKKNPVTTSLMVAGLPLALIGFLISDNHVVSAILFSSYLFILGVVYLVRGIYAISNKTLNFGFLLISLSVILRFFDSDWSFTIRGIAFSLLGVGFLLANIVVARKKGGRP